MLCGALLVSRYAMPWRINDLKTVLSVPLMSAKSTTGTYLAYEALILFIKLYIVESPDTSNSKATWLNQTEDWASLYLIMTYSIRHQRVGWAAGWSLLSTWATLCILETLRSDSTFHSGNMAAVSFCFICSGLLALSALVLLSPVRFSLLSSCFASESCNETVT